MTDLQAQVEALKGTPAAQSQSVVNVQSGSGQQQEDPADRYLAHLDSARELYDLVAR